MSIAQFPGFQFDLSPRSIITFIIEVIILTLLLCFICWIHRNDFHDHKYFKDCICPDCHGKMTKLYFSLDMNPNDKDPYIIYKCDCGYKSSAILCAFYERALYNVLQDLKKELKSKKGDESNENNK